MSRHGLNFYIEGASITVEEMANWAVGRGMFRSEQEQERAAHQAVHAIMDGIQKKIGVVVAEKNRAQWIRDNPPNHAGFYYCHLCAGWVHVDQAELDHIVPKSVHIGEIPDRDDNRRMAHAWPQYDSTGKLVCVGNREKGSRALPSKTLEIRPPDSEI